MIDALFILSVIAGPVVAGITWACLWRALSRREIPWRRTW
jgi:hypothetical protein